MSVITIIDDDVRALYFHTDSKIVHHKIKNTIRGQDFRDLLTQGAACLETNHAVKWLSDDRDSRVLAPDDAEWAEKVWRRRVLAAGFKYWAIVVPAHAVGSMQMRRFANEYRELGVSVEILSDLDTALGWLQSVR